MPAKFTVVDEPVMRVWRIRIFSVDNYLVFYRIDDETHTAHIVRFLYGKRNWKSVLRMNIG
ncbi:MAG: type II toxin-antitoxin system RelE/ParE family toxin [Anaerovibrio sp.]|uniref:type II toxin-antitoxin system RelE/ParE family toxin n=1 Tax=Anaerovibrio sp. TaxID=1872532 RepID=UPI0025F96A98|nr:type II toxin-antitoxin system RelE/ParE family toxin [Anaerovibrio sp.]MCR5176342.1 type II toxin-antitoxin system RelE/ParE family toxin [Anaerovibrio sp.]